MTMGEISKNLKRKMLRTKIALNQTIQKLLDINRARKQLVYLDNKEEKEKAIKQELRTLNMIADKQARLLKWYEAAIVKDRQSPPHHNA